MSDARNLLIDHWMGHENRDMGTRYAKQLIDRDAAAAILDRWPVEGQGSSLQTRCLTFQTATLLRCQRGNREVNCQRKVPVRICWQAYARCFPVPWPHGLTKPGFLAPEDNALTGRRFANSTCLFVLTDFDSFG
jgi:hypothetical protein